MSPLVERKGSGKRISAHSVQRPQVVVAPNPFNPSATIRVALPEGGPASLVIYNLTGQVVDTLWDGSYVGAGEHVLRWDGQDSQGRPVAAGVYLYMLQAQGQQLKRKMTLIR